MRRSLPAFSAQSAQIAKSISKSDRSSIASINVSSMISMPSFAPSASKSHDKGAKREQNPPYSHYNGLIYACAEGMERNASPDADDSAGAGGDGRVAPRSNHAVRLRRVEQLSQSCRTDRRAAGALARRRTRRSAAYLSTRRPGVEQRQGSRRRHVRRRHPPRRETPSPFTAKARRPDPAHPVDLDLRQGGTAARLLMDRASAPRELCRP